MLCHEYVSAEATHDEVTAFQNLAFEILSLQHHMLAHKLGAHFSFQRLDVAISSAELSVL
jgi:hypothetical protein